MMDRDGMRLLGLRITLSTEWCYSGGGIGEVEGEVGVMRRDMGLWGILEDERAGDGCVRMLMCVSELSGPKGRPRLHSCCG